jgi:hypothetical protein
MGGDAAVGEEAVVFVLDAGAWVSPCVTSHAPLTSRCEEKVFENARLTLIQPDGARIRFSTPPRRRRRRQRPTVPAARAN